MIGKQRLLDDIFSSGELVDDDLDYPLYDTTTDFADGFPFLIATEETFREISRWLVQDTKDVRIDHEELRKRYRPNIVIQGASKEGFEEDGWVEIRVGGEETIYPVHRCARCPVSSFLLFLSTHNRQNDSFVCIASQMPDASPSTGMMSALRMPGRIAEQYRKGVDSIEKSYCVGMNSITKARSGRLEVGMSVQVVRRAERVQDRDTKKRGNGWLRTEDKW